MEQYVKHYDDILKQLDDAERPVLSRCTMQARLGNKRSAEQREQLSKKLRATPKLNGDRYLEQIRNILASKLGMKRSSTQVKFHEAFLRAIARILFRSDGAQADLSSIMDRENWDDLQQQVCCLTPRRFGKTTG